MMFWLSFIFSDCLALILIHQHYHWLTYHQSSLKCQNTSCNPLHLWKGYPPHHCMICCLIYLIQVQCDQFWSPHTTKEWPLVHSKAYSTYTLPTISALSTVSTATWSPLACSLPSELLKFPVNCIPAETKHMSLEASYGEFGCVARSATHDTSRTPAGLYTDASYAEQQQALKHN